MDTSLTVATIDVRRRIPMSIIREVVRRNDFATARRELRQFRYPGQVATKGDAKGAFKSTEVIRSFLRSKLGLP